MGKAKKGKKVDYEDDADDHIETEKTADDDVSSKTKKKEKKVKESSVIESDSDGDTGKKKSKKSKDIDTATDGLKDLSISNKSKKDKKKGKGGASDDESEVSVTKSKKKGKKAGDDDSDEEAGGGGGGGRGGFAALALSDDEEPHAGTPVAVPSDDEPEQQKEFTSKADSKKAPGGKKAKKKKKDEDDEDLDQILAELELEYSGQAPPPKPEVPLQTPSEQPQPQPDVEPSEQELKKSKKKEKKKAEKKPEEDVKQEDADAKQEGGEGDDDDDGKMMKSAAQKRKEKKERDKQKRQAEAKTSKPKEEGAGAVVEDEKRDEATPEPDDKIDDPDADEEDDKKKKKKKKGVKEEKEKKGQPNKKAVAAMQEALKKIKEQEEKFQREEEERIKKEEEAERYRQEQLKQEQERKDKKKAKEKERKERLKAEGKLLTAKQKADKARAEAMIEAMKAMYGAAAITPGSKPAAPKGQQKKKKDEPSQVKAEGEGDDKESKDAAAEGGDGTPPPSDEAAEAVKDSWEDVEDVKDTWDADSGDEKHRENAPTTPTTEKKVQVHVKDRNGPVEDKDVDSDEETEESSEESDESESEQSSDEHQEKKTDAEKKREKALARIKARQANAEKNMTLDELRAAVVCVLGHVDTGKTKILDKLRRTNVQDGEAGGITQQIGATNVPIDAIKEQTRHVKGFSQLELKIPGLLIIDTPGHESFSNLRSRGSSLCDIAILVVDIMHGLEPQTIESLNLLKQRKTPFIVALNKIDRLYDWQTMNRKDIRDIIKGQASNTQLEFEQRAKEVILQFAEQGMNAALFYENKDPRSYVSLVPTSAITGEGMGNLLALIIESCQAHLAKRLMFSEELQATVLEVKAIPGLGTTIDVILVNGYLKEGDTVVLAGTEAPIVTQIRSLLMPQPLKELRVKNAYVEFKEIKAAQGVKIAAKDLEKVIAGLNLRVACKPDEVDILKEEAGRELKSALSSIKLQERGVYVQASTLGSLEALLEFLKSSSIPYANIRIGPVVKKDVMKASTMLEHDSQYATILAFDVKIERDAQELADSLGVRIFQADIIYHLFDKFMSYREELKRKKREEFKSIAVFPCKLRILPQFVFNSRDPIVMGVMVDAGVVKEGTPICVPSKEFVDIGIVTSIEVNHKNQETARKGQEVCIKIEPIPGEAPKMFGRHFDEKDVLVSKISRQSIDACKDHFREDLVKTDWQLMVELKKLFQIL